MRPAPGFLPLAICALLTVGSAVGVVYAKFETRKLFIEAEGVRKSLDAAEVEWGRLQLEQGALVANGRVERVARDRLKMHIPAPSEIRVVRP